MTGLLSSAALAVLIGWVIYALASLAMSVPMAAGLGAVIGLSAVMFAPGSMAVGGLVAVLAPFGVMLPALALRHVGIGFGLPVVPFSNAELIVFLIAYLAFLSAAMGVIPVDLYRYGYAPVPVAIMVLAICAYGLATGNPFLPLVAVCAQLVWMLGWGSSNWFDGVLHLALVPVCIVVLIQRMF